MDLRVNSYRTFPMTFLTKRGNTACWNKLKIKIAFVVYLIIYLPSPTTSSTRQARLPLPDASSKILIWPAEFSHWINLKIIASNLVKRGHQVSVLRSSAYQDFMEETEEFNFINFNVTGFKPGDHLQSMDHVLHLLKLGDGKANLIETASGMINFWWEQLGMRERQCHAIMSNHDILSRLAAERFDLVLSDPTVFGGEIIAHKLGVPFVYTVRTLPGEIHFRFSQTPTPVSYVPMINTEFSQEMDFLQRTANSLTYLYQNLGVELHSKIYMDPIIQSYLGPEKGFQQIVKNASMWLIRTDFAFEYPRPLMPSVKFIGGFHCKPATLLPQNLESFVNGSGEDGFIVFSMGSMVRHMHKSKASLIASAFAKLKQRVVWRYLGEIPETLGPNTKIMSWLPQNDLLGHPRCKLFVTHGGTNGLYEAIYHGVPMLGLPLLVDQFDNMVRIKDRGAGKTLDITNLNETELRLTMQEMIQDKSFKEGALRLSKLHKDKAMTPLDDATYWIEYVIRHKGAYHLRPAAHDLWWFQYQLLDVIAFLISVGIGVFWLIRFACRLGRPSVDMEPKPDRVAERKNYSREINRKSANGLTATCAHTEGKNLIHRHTNGRQNLARENGSGHIMNGLSKHVNCVYCSASTET